MNLMTIFLFSSLRLDSPDHFGKRALIKRLLIKDLNNFLLKFIFENFLSRRNFISTRLCHAGLVALFCIHLIPLSWLLIGPNWPLIEAPPTSFSTHVVWTAWSSVSVVSCRAKAVIHSHYCWPRYHIWRMVYTVYVRSTSKAYWLIKRRFM